MDYFKTKEFILCSGPCYFLIPYKMVQSCVTQGGAKSFQLIAPAFGNQLDTAVR